MFHNTQDFVDGFFCNGKMNLDDIKMGAMHIKSLLFISLSFDEQIPLR